MVVDDHLAGPRGPQQRGYALLVAATVDVEIRDVLVQTHAADGEDFNSTGLLNGAPELVRRLRTEPCFHACPGS